MIIFDDFIGSIQPTDSENYFKNLEDFLKKIGFYHNKKFIFTRKIEYTIIPIY